MYSSPPSWGQASIVVSDQKKISKEIEQYIHHSRSRILQQLALLLKSTTSAIRREYPTDQQPGTLKPRNWFQGKPPLVTVKYEPQSIVKSLVLSDWLLLFPAGVLSVEEQSFYEVLIRSGYRLMAWDGRRCVDIKKNNEVIDYHTLYERLENINFIPGNSTELKPHLSRLIDLNQFVLANFSWCQKQLDVIENLLNHRPRKCLGYKTPAQVFLKITGAIPP